MRHLFSIIRNTNQNADRCIAKNETGKGFIKTPFQKIKTKEEKIKSKE